MVFIETSFPRGKVARVNNENEFHDKKTSTTYFGAKNPGIKKKKSSGNKKLPSDIIEDSSSSYAEKLSHRNLTPGTIILGAISKIESSELTVSLPGKSSGKIPITNISQAYTNVLQKFVNGDVAGFKSVDEMFNIGQMFYVKVMDIEKEVILSMNPVDLHNELYHSQIQEGTILNCAVNDIEDHGYIVETGIKNLRAFLPKSNVKKRTLSIGQIVTCAVYKITTTPEISTVELGLSAKNLLKITDEPNINYIVPSAIVKFTIVKILNNGLQGTINGWTFDAIVTDNYLSTPVENLADYVENDTFDAKVLCVLPQTKIVYLTLNLTDLITEHSDNFLELGSIFNKADILKVSVTGVHVMLNNKDKGFINFRNKIKFTPNLDIETIKLHYYNIDKLTVRIMDYMIMDRVYICTDDPKLIEEKYFLPQDIKIGEIANFNIVSIDNGYFGYIGNIKGKIHTKWSDKNKKHNIGATMHVRVIQIHHNSLTLTNLPLFLKENTNILMDHNNIKLNVPYMGLVEKENESAYIIKFFNNIYGYLDKNDISISLRSKVCVEKAMEFHLKKINTNNTLSLILANNTVNDNNYGIIYNGRVNSHYGHGIDVTLNSNIKGTISNLYLSEHINLIKFMNDLYKEGTEIECVNIKDNEYSIRDVKYFKEHPIKSIEDIKTGDILRGFIKNLTDSHIEIYSPIKNYNKPILINKKSFFQNIDTKITLIPDQIIHVKVEKIVNNYLHCTGKLSDVWDCNLNDTKNIFENYLDDLRKIHDYQKTIGNRLAKYEIGDCITGKIISIDSITQTLKVELKNQIYGFINQGNYSKNIQINSEVSCFVLWIDFNKNYLDLTTDCISITKNVKYEKQFLPGHIILNNDDVIIAKLKIDSSIIFIPKKIHYNDFIGMVDGYIRLKQKMAFYIFQSNSDKTIGILGKLKDFVDIQRKKGVMDGKDILAKIPALKEINNKRKLVVEENKNENESGQSISKKMKLKKKKLKSNAENTSTQQLTFESEQSISKNMKLKKKKLKSNIGNPLTQQLAIESGQLISTKMKLKKKKIKSNIGNPSTQQLLSTKIKQKKKSLISVVNQDKNIQKKSSAKQTESPDKNKALKSITKKIKKISSAKQKVFKESPGKNKALLRKNKKKLISATQ